MEKNSKYPTMPFNTSDWLRCPELRVQAPDVRALWMDMLCYMWESPERGVMVAPNCKPYTQAEIVSLIGNDSKGSSAWLQTLIDSGVCGVREDGAIYNRRMVRDEDLRRKRAFAGSKGGKIARGKEMERKAQEQPKTSQESQDSIPVQGNSETGELFTVPEVEKPKKAKEPKIEFAEFVHLTQREYDRLVEDYGQEAVAWMIQKLDNSVGSNSRKRKYTDDNRAIRNWVVEAYQDYVRKNGTNQFTKSGGNTPATSGDTTFAKIPD